MITKSLSIVTKLVKLLITTYFDKRLQFNAKLQGSNKNSQSKLLLALKQENPNIKSFLNYLENYFKIIHNLRNHITNLCPCIRMRFETRLRLNVTKHRLRTYRLRLNKIAKQICNILKQNCNISFTIKTKFQTTTNGLIYELYNSVILKF